MSSEQVVHDLTVSIVTKETSDPAVIVARYLDLLPQIKLAYDTELKKRGSKTAVVPR